MTSGSRFTLIVVFGLFAVLTAIYGQTFRFDFVNWDDDAYVYANPQIRQGLTGENIYRSFFGTQNQLWHPLTTLSHLVDVSLYGDFAGGHHLSNVAIHLLASILLYLAWSRLTNCRYRSAMVAGLFALHPLRVESVAWIAERKDVLSGLMLSLVLLAYTSYVRKPSVARYVTMGVFFLLGTLSKPSFVTVPFVLWLIDYWPLRRLPWSSASDGNRSSRRWQRVEKLPLLAISAWVCWVTIEAQRTSAIVSLDKLPWIERMANAGRSYAVYLFQFFWPSQLAAFYPIPRTDLAFYQGVAGWCLIVALSVAIAWFGRSHRYLLVGWLWYLGMLIPNIGIVQSGTQAHADRFTYLPQIGLALLVTWGLADAVGRWRMTPRLIPIGSLLVLGALSFLAWRQVGYWRDGVTLFTRIVATQRPSEIVYNNLGVALHERGRNAEAIAMYEKAAMLAPDYAEAVINLGDSMRGLGLYQQAIPILLRANQLEPSNADVSNNLASCLIQLGRYDDAIEQLDALLARLPDFALARVNRGLAHFRKGKVDDAIADYRAAIELDPSAAGAYSNLAIALAHQKQFSAATKAFRESIRLRGNDVDTLMSAAWVTATDPTASADDVREAVRWAERGIELTKEANPMFGMMLAACYAANGDFPLATSTAERSEQLAVQQGNQQLIAAIRSHLESYRQNKPIRE